MRPLQGLLSAWGWLGWISHLPPLPTHQHLLGSSPCIWAAWNVPCKVNQAGQLWQHQIKIDLGSLGEWLEEHIPFMELKIWETWLELPISQSVCIWNCPPPPPYFPYISRCTDLCLPLPLHSHLVPGCWQPYLSASWLWPGHRKFHRSHHCVSLESVLRLLLRYLQHTADPIPFSAPQIHHMCAHTHKHPQTLHAHLSLEPAPQVPWNAGQ